MHRERELEQYNAIADVASEAFVTIDTRSVIQSVNPAVTEIFGYEPDELVGQPLMVLMPERFTQRHYQNLQRYLETGERNLDWEYIELPGLHKAGHEVPLAISFSEYEYEGDQYFTGIIRDNSDRKRLERQLEGAIEELEEANRQLEASNERLEQFASAASHDLQAPLQMVAGYLQLLEQTHADALDEEAEEYIETALDGVNRMSEMIEALLSYSRVDTDDAPLEPVDLEAVLEDVRTDLEARIEATDAEVDAEPLPDVLGDASQLRQLLQNLLENAITYAGEERPRIEITAERSGDEWVISVADEGIGIPPDKQESVFEVFNRLHTREEYEGTGLGLAMCRRIVARHGGDIWVDSDPGEGATFSFTLPAARDHET